MKISLRILLSMFLSVVLVAGLSGIVLRWNANSETDLMGYILHSGTTSGVYSTATDVGNVTETTFNAQPGVTHYFALSAYDQDHFESGNSIEVSYLLPTPAPTPVTTPSPTATATAAATPVSSPAPVLVTGTVTYCASQLGVPNVLIVVSGDAGASTTTDASGNYALALPRGGSYIVTPNTVAIEPGTPGIDTLDLVAVQRHYLQLGLLSGCALAAADTTSDGQTNLFDVIAIQRFYVGGAIATANVGQHRFTPVALAYPGLEADVGGQDYSVIILGDVISPFVEPQ